MTDWMIILVETPEGKKGNKFPLRTTVLDKLKQDIGGKTPERCVSVTGERMLEGVISTNIYRELVRSKSSRQQSGRLHAIFASQVQALLPAVLQQSSEQI